MNKKNLLVSLIIPLLFLSSCSSKKEISIQHDSQIESDFYGKWQIKSLNETELYSNPGTMEELLQGEASIVSTTELIFSENQKFKMIISSKLDKLNLIEEASFTKDEVKEQVEQNFIIEGTYCCDKEYLELENQTVTITDGTSYSAQEYSQIDSRIGTGKQITKYQISDKDLELIDIKSNSSINYQKVK